MFWGSIGHMAVYDFSCRISRLRVSGLGFKTSVWGMSGLGLAVKHWRASVELGSRDTDMWGACGGGIATKG